MVLESLRRTSARALLLVICLGLGVARPSLDQSELVTLLGLSAAYLASSLMVSEQVNVLCACWRCVLSLLFRHHRDIICLNLRMYS